VARVAKADRAARNSARGPCHARQDGFDLHAAVVSARVRARLERICRYALRPPVTHDRIRLPEYGQVRIDLRHRWADGTTHLLHPAHPRPRRAREAANNAYRQIFPGRSK
jgi:hypothetical protein